MTDSLAERWLNAAQSAMEEVAPTLGFDSPEVIAHGTELNQDPGAYIALVGTTRSVQLGLLATIEAHTHLARTFLGMEPPDTIDAEEIEDASREIANILGGTVKRSMIDEDPSIQLGLPIFVNGTVDHGPQTSLRTVQLRLGPVDLNLVVVAQAH